MSYRITERERKAREAANGLNAILANSSISSGVAAAQQRARELIAIAHPEFRSELTEQARRLNLI